MTEKRFTISDTDILCMTIIDNENGKHYGFAKDIAIVMNELNDKNTKLKEENEQLKMHMKSAKAHLEGGHTKKAIERLKIIDIR